MKPILFGLFGETVYAYPLFMGLGWGLGYHLLRHEIERVDRTLKGFHLFFWGNFLVSWIGAKVFFLLFSSGDKTLEYSINQGFWLGGGFVFLGGFIFGLLYSWSLISIFKKISFDSATRALPALSLGHAIGRIGCFFAGCCYGNICELPWRIHLHGAWRHPVQLYESFSLFALTFFMLKLNRKKISSLDRVMIYLLSYSFLRFILEFFRGDLIRGEFYGLSSSQWISLILIGVSLILLLYKRKFIKDA